MTPHRPLLFASWCLVVLCWAQASLGANERSATFTFVGDPQVGFSDPIRDYLSFDEVVEAINAEHTDLLVIPGDLTQDRTVFQRWLFKHSISHLKHPVLMVPGNHDVVDAETLALYRQEWGPDYSMKILGSVALIGIDSETARSPSVAPGEYEAQWAFIEARSKEAFEAGKEIVLIMHRPPFVTDEFEPNSEGNWPSAERQRLLSLCRARKVRYILAGHLHRTLTTSTNDGLKIVVLSGTARSYDSSPVGFDRLMFESGGRSTIEFQPVAAPRPAPPTLRGLREWTPRLLDFSFGHWFFTMAFAIAGIFSRKASRNRTPAARLFSLVSWAMFFFAANMQLDFDELFREVGRLAAKVTGLSAVRHIVTGTALALLTSFFSLRLLRAALSGTRKTAIVSVAGTGAIAIWFVLSTISHHYIGMVFDQATWDIITLVAISAVLASAIIEMRSSSRATAGIDRS